MSDDALLRIRRAWRCPCDGESDSLEGRAHNGIVEYAADVIEEVTGTRPMTCPWWFAENPLVAEVLAVHSAITADIGGVIDLHRLPHRVSEGLRVYALALGRARNERDMRKAQRGGSDDG